MKPEHRIVERLRSVPQVERIYLFGSRARGDAAPRADLDIAVSCPAADAVCVLHVFQKKARKGIATPTQEIDLIRQRLRDAEKIHRAMSENLTRNEL
jgi:predicted nucleotidyltransferase